jgi:hypothetical protein
MTVAELRALPVGARVRWPDLLAPGRHLFGSVATKSGGRLTIAWDDGQACPVGPDDDDLREFAGRLESVGEPPGESDEPLIVPAGR